jgi:hypothetical protein
MDRSRGSVTLGAERVLRLAAIAVRSFAASPRQRAGG